MVEKLRMTAAEFFELPESNLPVELIKGEVIMSPAPVPKHQRVSRKSLLVLENLIPNGELFYSPIDVYLDEDNVPQPDIVWVAADSRCVISEKRLEGPPDLIVEIFSPGTERRDKKAKFDLYQKFGVREYWMIDPEEEYVEVYRHENGVFVRQGVYGPDETFESAVLGKSVELQTIFGTGQ
jgi:Uma2 family endonuclease